MAWKFLDGINNDNFHDKPKPNIFWAEVEMWDSGTSIVLTFGDLAA